MNILCVKWGTKYSSEYVNKLYNMVLKNCNGQPFDFYCYTDNPSDLKSNIKTVNINSDLKDWWPKLDLLNIFNKDTNIFFDLEHSSFEKD